MRSIRILLLSAAVASGTVAVAAPASAYCDAVLYALTGRCTNAGCIVASGYNTAADKANTTLTKAGVEDVRLARIYCLH